MLSLPWPALRDASAINGHADRSAAVTGFVRQAEFSFA